MNGSNNAAPAAGLSEFTLPDLGEGLTDAVVLQWLVEVGDPVEVDQPIIEVESAKAVVEIPCPYAGIIESRHGSTGDILPVGSPLVRVREQAHPPTHRPPGPTPSQVSSQIHRQAPVGPGGEPALVGFGPAAADPAPTANGTRWRRRTPRPDGPQPQTQPAPVAADAEAAPRVISPIVRRLARTANLDLTRVPATGAGGVVRRADVELALRAIDSTGSHRPPLHELSSAPAVTRIPLTVRRAIADRVVRSRREIPEATTWRDVDFTGLLAAREASNARHPDRPVSVLALLARFCVAGLARYPELNSTVNTGRGEIVRYPFINLGFAIAADTGLVVPVVKNAETMTAAQLSEQLRELTARARDRRLTPTELTGGTFTINNHGALGTDGAAPIINHPEVAQLAVGRIAERPWVVDGQVCPRRVAQLTVAFDHRACDGGPVAGFITFLAHCIEQPLAIIADL